MHKKRINNAKIDLADHINQLLAIPGISKETIANERLKFMQNYQFFTPEEKQAIQSYMDTATKKPTGNVNEYRDMAKEILGQ